MKRLFIVRHGKSDWEFESVKDFDRTLKERGISDGHMMAQMLASEGLIPEMILSSNANRALHTAVIFHRVLEMKPDAFRIEPDLYLAEVDETMDILFGIDDSIQSVMIFGHNPGFTELANYLSRLNISNIPTTGIVMLDFKTEKWTGISKGVIAGERFEYPGKLR